MRARITTLASPDLPGDKLIPTAALIADPTIYRCEIGDCPEMAATFAADQTPVCAACSTVSAGAAVAAGDVRLEQMVTLGSVHGSIDATHSDAQAEDARRRGEATALADLRARVGATLEQMCADDVMSAPLAEVSK